MIFRVHRSICLMQLSQSSAIHHRSPEPGRDFIGIPTTHTKPGVVGSVCGGIQGCGVQAPAEGVESSLINSPELDRDLICRNQHCHETK
jgi:hypothetical protein